MIDVNNKLKPFLLFGMMISSWSALCQGPMRGHHSDRPPHNSELREEMHKYFEQNILPILLEKRGVFEAELISEEKAVIDHARANRPPFSKRGRGPRPNRDELDDKTREEMHSWKMEMQGAKTASNGWTSTFSVRKIQEFAEYGKNPFGPSASACFVAANIFRFVFKEQLPFGVLDEDFTFSVVDLNKGCVSTQEPNIENVNIGEYHLIGLGAIGNGTVWALSHLNVSGKLHLIDDEAIDLSNLQRYILSTQKDKDSPKVESMKAALKGTHLEVLAWQKTWQEYLREVGNFKIEKIALCLDSAEDRIAVQGCLPKIIINSWTQYESIGISRHFDFLKDPCVTCLYMPDGKKMSKSEIISESLGIIDQERKIRDYIAEGKTVDSFILELVSKAKGIDLTELERFEGMQLEEFYSKAACGGVLLKLSGKNEGQSVEVPSAFESAMAGIIVAAEMVFEANVIKERNVGNISRINMMRPVSQYISETSVKHPSGKCICQDSVFTEVYKSKWLGDKV